METFIASLHELENGPKEIDGPLTDEWLTAALSGTDVQPAGKGDGSIELTVTKTGREILVQGRLRVTVQVPCARTMDPAVYALRPEIFLMLVPGKGEPEGGRRRRRRPARETATVTPAKATPKKGKSGKEGAGGWEKDSFLSEELAGEDTYSGEQVLLDGFIREFILLEVPMVPLREDLRGASFEANPALPEGPEPQGAAENPANLDPRLSPLRELKARLEKGQS